MSHFVRARPSDRALSPLCSDRAAFSVSAQTGCNPIAQPAPAGIACLVWGTVPAPFATAWPSPALRASAWSRGRYPLPSAPSACAGRVIPLPPREPLQIPRPSSPLGVAAGCVPAPFGDLGKEVAMKLMVLFHHPHDVIRSYGVTFRLSYRAGSVGEILCPLGRDTRRRQPLFLTRRVAA